MFCQLEVAEVVIKQLPADISVTQIRSVLVPADQSIQFPIVLAQPCCVSQGKYFPVPFFFSLPEIAFLPAMMKIVVASRA